MFSHGNFGTSLAFKLTRSVRIGVVCATLRVNISARYRPSARRLASRSN